MSDKKSSPKEPPKPRFFKSSSEFRKWLGRNHDKATELWVGFHKGRAIDKTLTQKEAFDQVLCFGWTYGIVRGIDPFTYMIRFNRRKPRSAWSAGNIKRAKELAKLGLMHEAGLNALRGRDKTKSEERPPEFTRQQEKLFRADKKAWEFFSRQTPSYRKYMTHWVVSAKKAETQEKRLRMLIGDSARESKLARIVEATERMKEKKRNSFKPGETPIEEGRNLGAVSGSELRSVGIETIEQLKAVGWEQAFYRLCELHPHRANLNMIAALAGAVEDQDWRKLDPEVKAEAKAVLFEVRRTLGRA